MRGVLTTLILLFVLCVVHGKGVVRFDVSDADLSAQTSIKDSDNNNNKAVASPSTSPSPSLTASKDVVPSVQPAVPSPYAHAVKVFHFLIGHWGESRHGLQTCETESEDDYNNNSSNNSSITIVSGKRRRKKIYCEWVLSDHLKHLRDNLLFLTPQSVEGVPLVTLSLYNIHSWWERTRDVSPAMCELRTNLSMAETEESFVRYGQLFDASFKNFDGFSSTHPRSSLQRIYKESLLNASELLPLRNFSSLVKGASYVASDCHRRDNANANRDFVVQMLRTEGFRVDGLGRCMHTEPGPEGISLPKTRDTRYNLYLKRSTIGHFMFNLAFENSIEPGYVTEKPFDALIAGTVPVFLGDSAHLRTLLPHPKAAIMVSDYNNNYTALVQYLQYLTTNETAYEEHRSGWRQGFSYEKNVRDRPLMRDSWFCRVCQWAVKEAPKHHKRTRLCVNNDAAKVAKSKLGSEWEGLAVRPKNSKQVYLVRDGLLHPIPDIGTFLALKLDFERVKVVDPSDFEKMIVGDEIPRTME